jgi:hypothetical protein
MAVRLSALRAGRPLPLRRIPSTHFCQRLSRRQDHNAVGKIRSIEKSNDLIGSRTLDLPACSVVPQPTALPSVKDKIKSETTFLCYIHVLYDPMSYCE